MMELGKMIFMDIGFFSGQSLSFFKNDEEKTHKDEIYNIGGKAS